MTSPSAAENWTRTRVAEIAAKHFPGRQEVLWQIVREAAERHELEWRRASTGVFRPTVSMYALALGWRLDEEGSMCSVCKKKIAAPTPRASRAPRAAAFTVRPNLPTDRGGINVPQNLILGHLDCFQR